MSKDEDEPGLELPILTDVVELRAPTASAATGAHRALDEGHGAGGAVSLPEEDLQALQADLVARALNLTDELLHGAGREREGVLFERVLDRLRAALPELIDTALREHFTPPGD